MGKFAEFLKEQDNEKPYRMILLMNSTPDDPNKTGVTLEKEAKKMNIQFYQFEVNDGYITTSEKGNYVFHNYSIEKNVKGDVVNEIHDKKGFEIIPEDTVCFVRGGDENTIRFANLLRYNNVYTANSKFTQDVCDDKFLTYELLKKYGLRQPKSAYVKSTETLEIPIKTIGNKFPMLMKTVNGSGGVGVIYIESEKSLMATLQLIKKLDPSIISMVQEFIKTDYDVRVLVLNNEVVGQLKRPVIENDFRSNISQGNEPQKIELTDLEKSECLKTAKAVKGLFVGVDFIPAKNREKEKPIIIEVNASPGTSYINELNNIDIQKMILNTFKNRDNWRL